MCLNAFYFLKSGVTDSFNLENGTKILIENLHSVKLVNTWKETPFQKLIIHGKSVSRLLVF